MFHKQQAMESLKEARKKCFDLIYNKYLETGSGRLCREVGGLYEFGIGCEKNLKIALEYFLLAKSMGINCDACIARVRKALSDKE
jgi:TPR repeat protein